ncbi:hypothetical protein CROQUDRAFT_97362 [Cronartium quercuum f. sp. fusiforme G11]|uniref:Uncharacterized protein n=1 Tax=Cronartium quercuum f. sp. fusiforme G11 TaxID=708437 RepID=A0A9P6NF46_9BASI|nr:hypothetical protein CROQUDRAFT_97362 [Cronartium quercuum f. sp. fusiforme G11]
MHDEREWGVVNKRRRTLCPSSYITTGKELTLQYRAVASTATVLYFLQRQLPLWSVTCSRSPSSIITFTIDINASRA